MSYAQWRARHPHAAQELEAMTSPATALHAPEDEKSEGWAQQQARFQVAKAGAMSWRNNVGATKAKETHVCPACRFRFEVIKQPVRYGLANESPAVNRVTKSSDLILAIPRRITPDMVGTTIAQFGSLEVKRPGWVFNPRDEHQVAQQNWLTLVNSLGGYARFCTGEVAL